MTTNILQENFNNLTSIWKIIGQNYQAFNIQPEFEWVNMKDKSWPNRLWLTKPVDSYILDKATKLIQSTKTPILLPHYSKKDNDSEKLFIQKGFHISFSQIGMSLNLEHTHKVEKYIDLKPVKNLEDANLWSHLFEQSFGYQICPNTIANTCHNIKYDITSYQNQPIGTLITHQTDSIFGVHALGIIPNKRKQGFADAIMKTIINQAIENQTKVMTLQASEMGKHMYLNLGFKIDFTLNTYAYNTH